MDTPSSVGAPAVSARLVSSLHAMYALHAATIAALLVITVLGHRTLIFGIPALAAAAIGLALCRGARGSWLASHFSWQLQSIAWTFALLGIFTLAFGSIVVILTRLPLLEISFIVAGIWAGIRIARGWKALREARAISPSGIF